MGFNWKRSGLLYIVILVGAVSIVTLLFTTPQKPDEVSVNEVIEMSRNNEIDKILEEGPWLTVTRKDGTQVKSNIGVLNYNDLRELGLDINNQEYEIKSGGIDWGNWLIGLLPFVLFAGLIFYIFFRARGANNQAMSFGRSRARLMPMDKPSATFDDVAGADEAKQELTEIVEFLKAREKFQSLGARIPKGVLLVGPPGTGKTLMARAVAGEAGVPFFSISGSEFVEMFVGVGASRVRDLFEQAKRHAPCIVFVDEIDAVGRQRGAGLGGSHDEREQTLNQILTEMDGFDTNTSVIVLAATNRPDILDPALLRPGRFDRQVVLNLPDLTGREAILLVHSKEKPLEEGVKLDVLAKQTAGFSGADLENLINEAAILAARRNLKQIRMIDLEESIDKVLMGPERKSHRMNADEKEITAYHEAGHALVGHLLPNIEPVRKISIIPRGMAGGYTKTLSEDKEHYTRSYLKEMLAFFLGGRAAEEIKFNEIISGAQDDIKRATNLARKMVTDLGMSDILGPRTFGQKQEMVFLGREIAEQKDYSDKTADLIDKEVDKIITEAHDTATGILTEHKEHLVQIADILLERETIEGDELEYLFKSVLGAQYNPKEGFTRSTASLDNSEEKPKRTRKPRKSPIIADPLQEPPPPIPDSP
ncbi:MAG: ATP-dependent zinc metalloprotease FtsH [Dehalococcoidales bacterium]|nr:ATP-dependent zinc metalloprotease FtsH [Dehalococcoidales bacterium]